jgi:hypothetical protein
MNKRLVVMIAGACALMLPALGQAVPLTVQNFSFESPAHPLSAGCFPLAGPDCSFSVGIVDAWIVGTDGVGVFHPGVAAGNYFFDLPLPDGSQTAYSNGGGLSQQLSDTLQNNTTYTLSVEVGKRHDIAWSAYSVALYAGSTLLGVESSLDPLAGTFDTSVVTYASLASDPLAGEALRIVLFGAGPQVNFDNVRLDATPAGQPVPEPGTLLLVGSGVAAMISRSSRRRRP